MKKLGAVFLLVVSVVACGKRGDPRPPVPVIPQATSDLLVTQRGGRVILSWSYPSLTTAGKSLTSIRRVVVYRLVEEQPVSATGRDPNAILPGDVDTTAPQAVTAFAKVPGVSPPQFVRLRQRLDSIEGANLPAATAGARLVYEDTPPIRTADGRPVRVNYAVVTEGEAARSEQSNIATIIPLDVPVPPTALVATPRAEGVVLTWKAPATGISGAEKPPLAGYNVYRVATGSTELGSPINATPVMTPTYTDTPPYGAHEYRVSAIAAAGLPSIESEPSAVVGATYKDLLSPPPPSSVAALMETKAVRLVWDPVDAPDLAGYNVYRWEHAIRLKLTPTPFKETNFRDISIDIGIEYHYDITSIDNAGNESAPVKSQKVLVPKTP